MPPADLCISPARGDGDLRAAHDLFRHRIGAELVEDWESFVISATRASAYWMPLVLLAEAGGRVVAAQLGGLLPRVRMLSLPYTAVAEGFEGRGIYTRLKRAMIEALRAMASARGLPEPLGNVAEEAPGSAQYERKVVRGKAVVLPIAYVQPAVQGLEEHTLALTYEPLLGEAPTFTRDEALCIAAAVYQALYRIELPEQHPAYRRMAASAGLLPGEGRG
jgi:hypothetical protein